MTRHTSTKRPDDQEKPQSAAVWVLMITAVLLIIATLTAFSPCLHNQFLNWDDDRNFLDNPYFQGLGSEQLRWAWRTYHLGVWQPLSWILLSVQQTIAGLNPTTYHLMSLGLHCANTIVFFLLIVLMLKIAAPESFRRRPARAVACAGVSAAFFAVHPLRVEVVAWISSQPYLPAVLFYMLGLCAYLWGHRHTEKTTTRWPWLGVTFVCYLLAVGFKAVAVSLPAVLLILDAYPLRRFNVGSGGFARRLPRILLEKLPFLVVAVVISVWAAEAKVFNASRVPFRDFHIDARLAQSAYGLWFYPIKTIVPVDLIPYYQMPHDLSLSRWPFGPAAVGIVAICAGLFLTRRRYPAAPAAWAAYCVILLPNLGLVQISQQITADRYGYLAIMPLMIGLAGGLFVIWNRLGQHRPKIIAGAAAVFAFTMIGLGLATARQSRIWHDSKSLWRATLDVDPNCAVAECELGQALVTGGDYQQGAEHFRTAIKLASDFSFAHSNLGAILLAENRLSEAVREFQSAMSGQVMGPADRAKTHAGLGAAYAGLGQYDRAWRHTREAQRLGFPENKLEKMIRALGRVSTEPTDFNAENQPVDRADGD